MVACDYFIQESRQVRLRRSFEGHQRGVSHIAWSPDSLHIIVCGPEDSSELIIWNTEVCLHCTLSQ